MQEAEILRGHAIESKEQAALAVEPGEGALDNPAMPPQSVLRFDAAAGDAVLDAADPAGVAALAVVIALVGMGLPGAMPWPAGTAALQCRNRF